MPELEDDQDELLYDNLADDDFCQPITRQQQPRTWRFHDATPKDTYL